MSHNEIKDEPKFVSSASPEPAPQTESLEMQQFKAENKRKDEILKFGMRAVLYVLILTTVLLAFDTLLQFLKFDNTLLTEVFSVLKYSLTTALGFIFATSRNN